MSELLSGLAIGAAVMGTAIFAVTGILWFVGWLNPKRGQR